MCLGLPFLPAPRVAALAAMVLSTTERAAEIPSTCIPRMREEANSTVAAENRTLFQIGTIAQDGIQRELILTNKRQGAIVLVPIFAKRKKLPDGYDKIARFSVKMLSVLCISSSYSLEAKASRCGARIFYVCMPKFESRIGATAQRDTNGQTRRRPSDADVKLCLGKGGRWLIQMAVGKFRTNRGNATIQTRIFRFDKRSRTTPVKRGRL